MEQVAQTNIILRRLMKENVLLVVVRVKQEKNVKNVMEKAVS